jgi:hypothetical protein
MVAASSRGPEFDGLLVASQEHNVHLNEREIRLRCCRLARAASAGGERQPGGRCTQVSLLVTIVVPVSPANNLAGEDEIALARLKAVAAVMNFRQFAEWR